MASNAINNTRHGYWLYRWIDEIGIRSIKDLHKAAKSTPNIDRLQELSYLDTAEPLSGRELAYGSVVAGRRIDLSGSMGCIHFDCIAPQINSLFSKVWHYFDAVTVDSMPLTTDHEAFHYTLEQRVKLLL
jgi:hypothetical protein